MRSDRSLMLPAEVALTAITLAAVLGMHRLFAELDWLGPLAANAIAAHVVVTVCRRRGFSLPTTALIMAVSAAVVATWTCYWYTTTVGIPTGDTWSVMRADLSDAWTLYQDVVAPAPVETGFVLASAVALWCVAYVADWAAFRLWVPFEATLPAGTLFLFTALLGTARGRGWAVGLYAATLLMFLLVHRLARQDGTSHWVAERRGQGHRALLTVGTALGAMAVLTGAVFGPSLPGADDPGVLDPRSFRDGDDSRVTISPLVDIKSRLVNQANVEVFQVRSPQPAYWRLTSLENFDGSKWWSSGSYSDADGTLPVAVDSEVAAATFEQTFSIRALAAIWLPSAYEPRALAGEDLGVLYDEESSTLIVDKGIDSSDGIEYSVTSSSPRITEADLAGSSGEVPGSIRDQYLELPDDMSQAVLDLAAELTADSDTPYAAALALQDHLRTFTYDLTVRSGHSGDVLEQFLFETRRGYCEQFAGAFAAMARSIGIPARVAVGFTSGVADPGDPQLYRVRGEHAHAWPEVFLAGAGWVSFEPTPGRGMPFAEDYTGVPVAQAASGSPGSSDVAPTTTALPSGDSIPTLPNQPDLEAGGVQTGSAASDESERTSVPIRYVLRPVAKAAPVVVGLVLLYVLCFPLALVLRRRRRRRRATAPEDRIALAWAETVEDAASLAGFHEVASDTFGERSTRLTAAIPGPDVADHAMTLSRQLEQATYAPDGADDLAAELAEEASAALGAAARAATSRWNRIARWLDPRPYVRASRRGRALRHRRITTTVRADLEVERQLVGTREN